MLKDDKVPTGTSLADYLRAESHNSGTDEEADKLTPMQPEEQLTEWERFTTLPGVRMLKRPKDQLYEDLIANSLDDYDEKTEEEYEIQHRNNDEPVQFGPITREEFIRLTFCRIRRHNARSKLQNDTPKSYYFSAQVGEGSFSTVYEAFRTQDRKQYAIKVANKRQIQRERKVQYVVREKDIMATLKYGFKGNPFIAGICCTFQEEDKLYYVMEYASNGELLMWLRRLGSFDLPTSQFYASEIASALEYIHECGCIHRDLKPENILIKSDWHIMLSDFGSAKVIGFGGDGNFNLKSL
jgi:tRNA A-37 threonylcarbamoyl transferase component Bud32